MVGEIEKLELFTILFDGDMKTRIPELCWKMKGGVQPGFGFYDPADHTWDKWQRV